MGKQERFVVLLGYDTMGKISDIYTRFQNMYKAYKAEILAWYTANSEDSQHEDYISSQEFVSITHIIQFADDLGDWYKLFLKWRTAGTITAKDAVLTELNQQVTDISNQYGLDEDDLAVAQLITAGMIRIIEDKQDIMSIFGDA